MKRFTILFLMACLFAATGGAKPKVKDISGSIAINGELKKNYRNTPAGTPVIIRRIIQNPKTFSLLYAIEINGIQETIPEEEMYIITLFTPQTDREFWQQAYFKNQLYKHFSERGYRHELRREIDEECSEYLDRLHEIAYQDDYITSYVQGVFAKLAPAGIDPNRNEQLNVRVIQSTEPDAYMLPNGSMLISTGLLCTLDSEDELAAMIATEIAHFVLDHQVENIYRAERRLKNAVFWGNVFSATAEAAFDIAYWNNDSNALTVSTIASLGEVASLLSIPAINRLGMRYKTNQEIASDRIARDLLSLKGYNPNGLSSALGKIIDYYNIRHRTEKITRYESTQLLLKRIEKAGKAESQTSYPYLKKTSDIVTFNAAMNMANQRYMDAVRLIQKNIDNNFASTHDYVILVKAKMALYNTEDINNECLSLLDKAQKLAGNSPNLDIYKQRILLLMRMNKQSKAANSLKEYLSLLAKYQAQGIKGEEEEWTAKEMNWAGELLDKISRI